MWILYADDDGDQIIRASEKMYFDYHADIEDLMPWDLESVVYYGRVR